MHDKENEYPEGDCIVCDNKGTRPMACPNCGRAGGLRVQTPEGLEASIIPCPRLPGGPLFADFHKAKCETCRGCQHVFVVCRVSHPGRGFVDVTRPLTRTERRAALVKKKVVKQHEVDNVMNRMPS